MERTIATPVKAGQVFEIANIIRTTADTTQRGTLMQFDLALPSAQIVLHDCRLVRRASEALTFAPPSVRDSSSETGWRRQATLDRPLGLAVRDAAVKILDERQ